MLNYYHFTVFPNSLYTIFYGTGTASFAYAVTSACVSWFRDHLHGDVRSWQKLPHYITALRHSNNFLFHFLIISAFQLFFFLWHKKQLVPDLELWLRPSFLNTTRVIASASVLQQTVVWEHCFANSNLRYM